MDFWALCGYKFHTISSIKLFPYNSSLPKIFNHSIWMSEAQLTAKTLQLHPKQSIPVCYQNSHLSPYLGALEQQFAPSPLYKFLSLAPMVLYQLESLNLDDYNLTYSQNKNRVLKFFLTATLLKLHHFLYTKISQKQSKPIKTMKNNLKLNENHPRTLYTNLWFFSKPKHTKRGVFS